MGEPEPAPPAPPAASSLIRGRYEPVAVLGRGGQGEVVRAIDHQHDREVALKIRPIFDEGDRQALLAEARILLTLRPHPNLPIVREDFFWLDRYVLAMDFIDGADLRQVLNDTGDPGLALGSVVAWLEQAADAVGHLHAQGVVHGDVKPANLVLTPDGRVVLVDFGIARRAGEPGRLHIGTPGYAAPELHGGATTPAADIYGLAATAVALLTGAPPSVGRPDWEGVPHAAAIERALRRGLAIDPSRRPRTAADLIGRLRGHLALDLPTGIVTFLLTDIEGSTARWEADPDAMAELVAAHDTMIGDAIESHDGRLLKSRGEGDATFSVFARASDAVAAAVDAQRALARLGLPVRMAIHTGEAEVRDGDYFGRTVNRASRLRAVARAGQVVLSGAAADLAGHALPTDVTLSDLGFKELRDLTRGEQVFAVVHPDLARSAAVEPVAPPGQPSRLPPSSVGLPDALTTLGNATFVGRAAELERLLGAWRQARVGDRHVVLIAGEPGIGKTHLTFALARAVHSDGGAVLYGSCDEGLQIPYQPFATALAQAVDDALDAGGVPLLGRHPADLARLVPHLATRLPQLQPSATGDPDADQHRLFDAVADWLRSITSVIPLLLVLDDLHWATRPTLQLLRHLVQVLDPAPLLVVGTYRDTESGRRRSLDELLTDLYRLPGVERTTLDGLSTGDVVELLALATGRELAPAARAVARAVRAETGGNPFLARQFLRHLIDTGTLTTDDHARWTVLEVAEPLGIPEGVREVMARRLGRLSDDARQAIEVAAVAGNEFELPVLTAALEVDEDTVLTGLEEAVGARLLTETGPFRFRFVHALIRSSIIDGLARARRSRLHRRVAQALESVHADDLDGYLTELAGHYAEAATRSDDDRAVGYAVRAGEAAVERLAYEEAANCFRLAVELTAAHEQPDESEHTRLLLLLGEAQRLAGDPVHRETLLQAGRLGLARRDAAVVAAAALANRRVRLGPVAVADQERLALLEAAVDLQSGHEGPVLARLLAQLGFELTAAGEWSRRVALSDRAVAMARRLGDPATLADVLVLRSDTIDQPSTLDERLRLADEQIERLVPFSEPALLVLALLQGVAAGFEAGRLELVDERLDRAERLAVDLGHPVAGWQVKVQRTKRLTLAGRLTEAGELAGAAFQLGQAAGQPDAPLVFAIQHLALSSFQRRSAEGLPLLAEAVTEFRDHPALLAIEAKVLHDVGRVDEARVRLEQAVAEGLGWLPSDGNRLSMAAVVAVGAQRLGLPEAAELVVPVLEPFGGQIVADRATVLGSVAHFLGLAALARGRLDEAEARLMEAIDVHRRLGAPVLLASAQSDLARVLAERGWPGDRTRRARLVDEAMTTAAELGLDRLGADLADID
ncbi:MAG: serine/threonine-protein kinase PknK [Acidimicrobiales bacterium]